MSRITKDTTAETYRIRVNHEWATIVLFAWSVQDTPGEKSREAGEILINSSYGQWAYSWSHMGIDFKRFLQKLDRGYVAGKLLSSNATEFDGELTVKDLRARLLEWRKTGELDKKEARAIWDYILEREHELGSGSNEFVEVMHQAEGELVCTSNTIRFIREPWEQIRTSLNNQFKGFWEEIWPAFTAELKREEAAEVPA